jgi:large subunit ribosomal protein L15
MRAPFRIRPQAPGGVFAVNEDPRKLDEVYIRMLGPGGDKMLGDEAKWLAVTHKSFDHGRMGFNDRLAYLGMSEPTNVTNEANRHQGDG